MARGLYVATSEPPVDVVSRAAVNNFTTFQDIYGAQQKIIPLKKMEVGLIVELFAAGLFGTTGTPTISIGFWFNGAALAAPTTILGQSQLAVTGGTTQASAPWSAYLRAILRATASGASGGSWRVMDGWAKIATTTTPFNTLAEWRVPTTEALRTVTCDVTADRAVGPGCQWGTASVSNTITVDEFELRMIS